MEEILCFFCKKKLGEGALNLPVSCLACVRSKLHELNEKNFTSFAKMYGDIISKNVGVH